MKLKIVTLAICLSFSSAFGFTLEPMQFSGAKVKVEGHKDPLIGVITLSEKTTLQWSSMASNRSWYYRNGLARLKNPPSILLGARFYLLPVQQELTYHAESDGELIALAPSNATADLTPQMAAIGFKKIPGIEPFALFDSNEGNIAAIYKKTVKKGESFTTPRPWCFILGVQDDINQKPENGETLYNGIVIPREWPPSYEDNDEGNWWPDGNRPMPVPYLEDKPGAINISVGRQLFVDDFLIAEGDFEREYHQPKKFEGNPIFKAETPLEMGKFALSNMAGVAPKDGGILWNPDRKMFEMWYEAGWTGTYAFAESADGIHWERPNLGLFDEPNQIMPDDMHPDSGAVVHDFQSADPNARYKMFNLGGPPTFRARVWTSADGKDFGDPVWGGISGDRSTMFYNPFRKKWIYSLRWQIPGNPDPRTRAYMEADDFVSGVRWDPARPVYWLSTDSLDLIRPEIENGHSPHLYNFNAVAYESIMLGTFQILWGPNNNISATHGNPKFTGLQFAYSRDGFHWSRPDRQIAIDSERDPAKWDNGYIQSVGGICTIHGDELHIYYIGYQGDPENAYDPVKEGKSSMRSGMYANSAVGLAKLRRDGFVSLNSKSSSQPATVTTEPVIFSGSYLFANIDAPDGALYAEVLDLDGKVIEPFSFANCIPATGDSTIARLRWKRANADLAALANKPVRFRFKMENGKYYAFWVSVSENGRSDGYVAGSGSGYFSNIDNVGVGALNMMNQANSQKTD